MLKAPGVFIIKKKVKNQSWLHTSSKIKVQIIFDKADVWVEDDERDFEVNA